MENNKNMKYTDLSIHQRMELKRLFITDESLASYRAVWILWGFKIAVEYFLNDDITTLTL